MRLPLYTFKVETDSQKTIPGLVCEEFSNIPPEVVEAFTERNIFALRLALEEFVVGLLKRMKTERQLSQTYFSPQYQIEVQLKKTGASICFNGHQWRANSSE